MPYARVLLSRRALHSSEGLLVRRLESELPAIIADELTVESAEPLTANDITLDGDSFELEDPTMYDPRRPRVLEGDVAIIIFGNDYPERVEKKDEIAGRIAERVKPIMAAGLKAYVWVLLCEGGFCSFTT